MLQEKLGEALKLREQYYMEKGMFFSRYVVRKGCLYLTTLANSFNHLRVPPSKLSLLDINKKGFLNKKVKNKVVPSTTVTLGENGNGGTGEKGSLESFSSLGFLKKISRLKTSLLEDKNYVPCLPDEAFLPEPDSEINFNLVIDSHSQGGESSAPEESVTENTASKKSKVAKSDPVDVDVPLKLTELHVVHEVSAEHGDKTHYFGGTGLKNSLTKANPQGGSKKAVRDVLSGFNGVVKNPSDTHDEDEDREQSLERVQEHYLTRKPTSRNLVSAFTDFRRLEFGQSANQPCTMKHVGICAYMLKHMDYKDLVRVFYSVVTSWSVYRKRLRVDYDTKSPKYPTIEFIRAHWDKIEPIYSDYEQPNEPKQEQLSLDEQFARYGIDPNDIYAFAKLAKMRKEEILQKAIQKQNEPSCS
jgi:hypothetical protein